MCLSFATSTNSINATALKQRRQVSLYLITSYTRAMGNTPWHGRMSESYIEVVQFPESTNNKVVRLLIIIGGKRRYCVTCAKIGH